MQENNPYQYRWMKGGLVEGRLLEELASLYSNHYGTWAIGAPRSFQRVRLSTSRLREWLASPESRLAYALYESEVVGYAIAIQPRLGRLGVISWVTQLVVHEDHRKRDVAKKLLFSIWGFSDHYAWGLVTANPYAVRALEKATRRRCDPVQIERFVGRLSEVGKEYIPWVKEAGEWHVREGASRLDSKFPIDHSELPYMLENVKRKDVPWTLGELPGGWEWLAFTFKTQPEIELTTEELESMVRASDDVAKQAYSRMRLTASHGWAKHTAAEVDFIIRECDLRAGGTALDIGCGSGRHVTELSRRGVACVGVDYLDDSIAGLSRQSGKPGLEFQQGDGRDLNLGRQFDAVLCLYDVIGSYAEDSENDRIVESIRRHLKPGGRALISVMNYELTWKRRRHSFSLRTEPQRLLELRASKAMETSGDVFDPDYYMIDEDAEIVYRKEQFASGEDLPVELLVRDRRYRRRDIIAKCYAAGLDVFWCRHVRAGRWDDDLNPEDDNAKEILLLCGPLG